MSLTSENKRKLSVGLLAALSIYLFSNVSSSIGSRDRGLRANQADIDELIEEAKMQAEKIAHGDFNVEITPVHNEADAVKQIAEETGGRPVMHTFFQPLEEGGSDPLLDLWRKEWEYIGFETRVLTMQDVESNPAYPEMKALAEAYFEGKDAGYYNMLCLYRYLAMANVGGYMSDYDTLPLNFPIEKYSGLVNDGKFTSFQGHVPSLISASASEWQRIAELFIKQMPVSTADWKSDMFLLLEVGHVKENDIILYDQGSYVETFLKYKERDVVDCEKYFERFIVLHCSHYAITTNEEEDLVPTYDYSGMDETVRRAKITEIFMDQWREQCSRKKFETS